MGFLEEEVTKRGTRSYYQDGQACYIMDAKSQGNIGRYLNVSVDDQCQGNVGRYLNVSVDDQCQGNIGRYLNVSVDDQCLDLGKAY